jgi:hypothetical protein
MSSWMALTSLRPFALTHKHSTHTYVSLSVTRQKYLLQLLLPLKQAADSLIQWELASLKYLSSIQKDRIITRTERSSQWVPYATDFAGFAAYECTLIWWTMPHRLLCSSDTYYDHTQPLRHFTVLLGIDENCRLRFTFPVNGSWNFSEWYEQ